MASPLPDQAKLNVVIVGGSLSGLMHGIIAKRLGHSVTIFERIPTALLAQHGAGIGVADALDEFIREYDTVQQKVMLCPPKALYVDSRGQLINTTKPGISATSWSTLYYRLRANFDGLKSKHCEKPPADGSEGLATYLHGREVVAVRLADGAMQVEFCDEGKAEGTVSADLVIAADGSGSRIREAFAPQIQCRYRGYAAWRGTILEKDMSDEAKALCQGDDRHCKIDREFFLSYTIPGEGGSFDAEKRLRNWVWYRNFPGNSKELQDILLDSNQRRHRFSLPPDTIRKEVWNRQQRLSRELLDFHSAELILKTKTPFFQVITEVIPEKASFCDGRLLLTGDSLTVLRPLSGRGTSQAANSALLLKRVLLGEMNILDWEKGVLVYAKTANRIGIERERILELGKPQTVVDGYADSHYV